MILFKRKPVENIIIGDSRARHIDVDKIKEMSGVEYFNLAIPGANYKTFIDLFWYAEKRIELKNVYIGVSFHNYCANQNRDIVSQASEIIKKGTPFFTKKILIEETIRNIRFYSRDLMHSHMADKRGKNAKGTSAKKQAFKIPQKTQEQWDMGIDMQRQMFRIRKYPEKFYGELKIIAQFCREKDINLTFVIFPNHFDFHDLIEDMDLMDDFERYKSDIYGLGKVYDFDYDNAITTDKKLFIDMYHVCDTVYDLILKEVWLNDPEVSIYLDCN